MLIAIKSHRYGAFGTGNKLGYDMIKSWLGAWERHALNEIGIEYTFRGFRSYQFSKAPDNFIEYLIAINEDDYTIVKITCGEVTKLEFPLDTDRITQITTMVDRRTIGMSLTGQEDWERDLSNPPKTLPVLATRSVNRFFIK